MGEPESDYRPTEGDWVSGGVEVLDLFERRRNRLIAALRSN
jgi:hypothetical protein